MFNERKDQEFGSSENGFENVEPTEMINANSTKKLTNVAKTQPDDVADEVFGALTAVNLKNSANELTSETQAYGEGIHASNLLHKLRPYLVRKGAEADVVFQFYRDGEPTRHFGAKGAPTEIWRIRERCFDALRYLK